MAARIVNPLGRSLCLHIGYFSGGPLSFHRGTLGVYPFYSYWHGGNCWTDVLNAKIERSE